LLIFLLFYKPLKLFFMNIIKILAEFSQVVYDLRPSPHQLCVIENFLPQISIDLEKSISHYIAIDASFGSLLEIEITIPEDYHRRLEILQKGKSYVFKLLPVINNVSSLDCFIKIDQEENPKYTGSEGLDMMKELYFNLLPKHKRIIFLTKNRSLPGITISDKVIFNRHSFDEGEIHKGDIIVYAIEKK